MSELGGLTYDGAANMEDKAIIKRHQPQWPLWLHSACSASALIHDAMQWVHEQGTLSTQFGKVKAIFESKVDIKKRQHILSH